MSQLPLKSLTWDTDIPVLNSHASDFIVIQFVGDLHLRVDDDGQSVNLCIWGESVVFFATCYVEALLVGTNGMEMEPSTPSIDSSAP